MTKPRLVKVRALLYILQNIKKEATPILTQPRIAKEPQTDCGTRQDGA